MVNMDYLSVGMLVRIVTPDEYRAAKGSNVRVSDRCALDYFQNQICIIEEINKYGVRLELLDPEFVNSDPKYQDDPWIGDIKYYNWGYENIDYYIPPKGITETEFLDVLYGA